ncbi:MAG: molybdenum ABC transporter ATP-binding protein [Rhodoblastus sp.]
MSDRIEVRFRGRLGAFMLDAQFHAPARGVTALFGPSGCGKTSVLRCIAGLQRLDDGYCSVSGEIWQDGEKLFLPPHRRAVGYVFQEASLFPHLSVRRNLLFGAGRADAPAPISLDETVDLLGLEKLLERAPHNLSGGERQRVAIGRALLSQPRLLLMDEPLSALDALTKQEILPFLERLHDRLSLPVMYISHDLTEVERLADHMALMDSGRVIAAGALRELQTDPGLPLARGHDAAVMLDAVVESFDAEYGLLTLSACGVRFQAPARGGGPGERRRLRIVAGDVSLARNPPGPSSILNVFQATIRSLGPSDDNQVLVVLSLGGDNSDGRLLARITRRSAETLKLAAGLVVYAQVKGVALAPPGRDSAGGV